MTQTQSGLQLAVIGGGIGGLFAANALISLGLNVTVCEQAPTLGEFGAGAFITPKPACGISRCSSARARTGSGSIQVLPIPI